MVERIEFNVGQSVVSVKKANVELKGAVKYQQSARKVNCLAETKSSSNRMLNMVFT